MACILYSQEQPLPTDEKAKKPTPEPNQEVTDKDFEVFYHQDAPSASKGVGFEEKTLNLMALLEAHVGSASPVVPMIPVAPRPPTPTLGRASSCDAADKNRKMGQVGKGLEDAEEEEVTHSFQQPLTKEARTTKAQ